VYGYCVYRYVGGVQSVGELAKYCSGAGEWEEECRHAWVSGMMNGDTNLTTEVLLEACGGSVDCTFELIDKRLHPDVLIQIDRCARYAGRYAGDCVGHAMQRWYQSKPSLEEFERVVVFDKMYEDKVGYWAGAVVQCIGVGACPPTKSKKERGFCGIAVENFVRRPSQCPPMSKTPLPHHNGTTPKNKKTATQPHANQPRGHRPPGSKHGPPNGVTPPTKGP